MDSRLLRQCIFAFKIFGKLVSGLFRAMISTSLTRNRYILSTKLEIHCKLVGVERYSSGTKLLDNAAG